MVKMRFSRMRRPVWAWAALPVTLLGVAANNTHAVPLFDVTFESDADNTAPSVLLNANVAANPAVNAKPTQGTNSNGGTSSKLVQSDYIDSSTSNTVGSGNVLVVTNTSGSTANEFTVFRAHPDDITSSGQVIVEFDMMIDSSSSTGAGQIELGARDAALALPAKVAILLTTGQVTLLDGNTGNGTNNLVLGNLALGQAAHFKWTLDYDADTMLLEITGALNASGSVEINPNKDFLRLDFFTANAANGIYAIDNITIGPVVPEPASLGLMSVGTLLALGGARQQR